MAKLRVLKKALRRKAVKKSGTLTRINKAMSRSTERASIRGKKGLRRKFAKAKEAFLDKVGGPSKFNPASRVKRLENMRKKVVRRRAIGTAAALTGATVFSNRRKKKTKLKSRR